MRNAYIVGRKICRAEDVKGHELAYRYSAIVYFLCDNTVGSPRCTWCHMVVVVSNELARIYKEATLG